MTDLRKAAEMALKALEGDSLPFQLGARAALRQALAQPDEVLVEREACAKVADQWDTAITDKVAEAIRARGENPPVKTYCGGKPNYCTPEVTPEVTGEVTGDVDAVNMSQERVDETEKRVHEPWQSVQCTCGGTIYFKHTKREWVGIGEKEVAWLWFSMGNREGINGYDFARAIEAKLKEKNGG